MIWINSRRQTAPATLALGGLLALAAAIGIGRFVYTPILPFMLEALGWTKAQAGFVASANFLGYLLGAFAATRPEVVRRPRAWLLGSLAVSGATTLGMAADVGIPGFMALRLVGGAASASGDERGKERERERERVKKKNHD